MTGKCHAEIAGAGFAGLVAGTALAHRGWSVRVHEIAPELRAFGAGIFIWENGLRVLAAIGAYEAVIRGAHEAIVYETRQEDRRVAEHLFTREYGSRMLTMTRQHLYTAILAVAREAGVEFRTSSEVIGARPEGVLLTADGARYPADLVIGADGVKSKVRDSLGLLSQRSACADGIVRVLAPRCKGELAAGTDWDHVIDFWNLRRSLRVLYVPCNEHDLYLAMMSPVDDAEASAIPIRQEIWVPAFPQLEPILRHITAGGRYDAYETTRLSCWSAGRVAIVGDAAHAMVPTLGQGAGTAMMNALALAVAMDEADGIDGALKLWEDRERPLSDYTQDLSEHAARQRTMSGGDVWNDLTLRAACHIPTGTSHLPRHLA